MKRLRVIYLLNLLFLSATTVCLAIRPILGSILWLMLGMFQSTIAVYLWYKWTSLNRKHRIRLFAYTCASLIFGLYLFKLYQSLNQAVASSSLFNESVARVLSLVIAAYFTRITYGLRNYHMEFKQSNVENSG
jgi:hypothetical protein